MASAAFLRDMKFLSVTILYAVGTLLEVRD
jgi:hypothetical protein